MRATPVMRRLRQGAAGLGLLALLTACEHPLGIVTPHIEAADLLVTDSSGTLLTRTEFNRSWTTEPLVLTQGEPLRIIVTPIDFRGTTIDLSQRSDLSVRMEAEHPAMLQWEPQRGFGWIRPFVAGETRIRILIWHLNHADFVTPWLPVVIGSPDGATANLPTSESLP